MKKHKIKLPSFEHLENLNACQSAQDWVTTQKNQKTAYYNCLRGDWIIWVLHATGQLNPVLDLQIQLMALRTPLGDGRKVIDLITDKRSLTFIEMKEIRLNGEYISDDEWRKVKRDAVDAVTADAATYADDADDADVDGAAYANARLFQANEIRKMIEIVD